MSRLVILYCLQKVYKLSTLLGSTICIGICQFGVQADYASVICE